MINASPHQSRNGGRAFGRSDALIHARQTDVDLLPDLKAAIARLQAMRGMGKKQAAEILGAGKGKAAGKGKRPYSIDCFGLKPQNCTPWTMSVSV